MSEKKPNRADLGDLLGERLARPQRQDVPPAKPSSSDQAEQVLASLAKAFELDPGEVIDDYRKGGPIAELARRLLGADLEPDKFWSAVDMGRTVLAEGYKGKAAHEEAARRLNAKDPAGRPRRNISANAVKTYLKQASAFEKRAALLRMFAPEGCSRTGNSYAKAIA